MIVQHEAQVEPSSRFEILENLEKLGVNPEMLDQLSIPALNHLLKTLQKAASASPSQSRPGRRKSHELSRVVSPADKKILKALLSSTGGVSSLTLSKELDIPLSTVQRRRKRLEANLLEMSYTLKVERFGWRTATLFISTRNGMTAAVGKEILSLSDGVKSVNRILGENSADLMVEIIFRNNAELLNMVEKMKSINGVGNVFWIELIEPMGKNTDFAERVIEAD
ncbi:MAG TPA: Lrp/AsnC family transcriptional regulator [Nitrososphaera sp.]|nr:Lrp/AsnC family transcriptional regulator [Nitrososphaera sp.]